MALTFDCDGAGRRDFLRLGMLGLGGLSLPDLLKAQRKGADKSLIFVWLGGGPPQTDTYDMKPDAPLEFRGEFKPISTKVPGMQMCELLPHTAAQADKLCIFRSMTVGGFGQPRAIEPLPADRRAAGAEYGFPVVRRGVCEGEEFQRCRSRRSWAC